MTVKNYDFLQVKTLTCDILLISSFQKVDCQNWTLNISITVRYANIAFLEDDDDFNEQSEQKYRSGPFAVKVWYKLILEMKK